jgi:hypothetical protein
MVIARAARYRLRMRLRVAAVVVLAFGASACAAITGLGDYGDGKQLDEAALQATDSGDAQTSTTDGTVDDEASADGTPGDEEAMSTVDPDAAPPCGPGHCGGCCMNNVCYGGASVSTCGVSGALCIDCSNKGGACSAEGACTTPPKDAGTAPACNATKCLACAPVYQSGCCKSDNTCGCKVNIPPSTTCN